jgi:hypothetical protein
MTRYDPKPQILGKSLEELKYILNWIKERGEPTHAPITVLIGGWAVYAYNPYYRSVDIDLVTNKKTKKSLKFFLRTQREFTYHRILHGVKTVSKTTEYGDIIIDFSSKYAHNKFEGRNEQLNFDTLNDQTITKATISGVFAAVPTRSLLMLFKLKASWDRSYRLNSETSTEPDWERGKLIKDYADIIALLDPNHGGTEIDLNFLGDKLNEFDFLRECLRRIPENHDAIGKYNRMDQRIVRETIDRLLQLTA